MRLILHAVGPRRSPSCANEYNYQFSYCISTFGFTRYLGRKNSSGFGFPSFSFGASMELMAVPKKKVSPHKKGIRNGPKALKPVPVIIRCRSCGRVKLPHFFCCSGERRKEE